MPIGKPDDSINASVLRPTDCSTELALILKLGSFLAGLPSLREMLEGAISIITEYFKLDAGRVYLIDGNGQSLILAGSKGIDTDGLEKMRLNEGFSGMAVRTRSFLTRHVSELDDERRAGFYSRHGLKTIICVPLMVRNEIMGVMNFAATKDVLPDSAQIDLLCAAGSQVAIAASHARLYEDFRKKEKLAQFMMYSVSHDLRSPAVGAHGLARLLSRRYANLLDEKGNEYCTQIMNATGHIVALVEDVMSYASTQNPALNIETVNLKEIIETLRCGFSQSLEARNIQWLEPDRIPTMKGDRVAIARILQNLVDNALKYGGDRLSEIRVEYDEDDHFHILSVTDDGIGIEEEVFEHIFELFTRADTARGTKGTGLGLPIIREMAKRHQGKVWVESGHQKGARFCVAIPKDLCAERLVADKGDRAK